MNNALLLQSSPKRPQSILYIHSGYSRTIYDDDAYIQALAPALSASVLLMIRILPLPASPLPPAPSILRPRERSRTRDDKSWLLQGCLVDNATACTSGYDRHMGGGRRGRVERRGIMCVLKTGSECVSTSSEGEGTSRRGRSGRGIDHAKVGVSKKEKRKEGQAREGRRDSLLCKR